MLPILRYQMENQGRTLPAVRCSFVVSTFLFLLIMISGYLGFGNLGPDNMILGMRANRPAGWWATERPWETGTNTIIGQVYAWTIIVNLLLSDAIYVPCTIVSVEAVAPDYFEDHKVARVILRLVLTAFRMIVATSITSFIYLTNLTSACFVVTNNIILPVIGFYVTKAHPVGPMRKVAHAFIGVFGFYVLIFGSYGAIMNMITTEAVPPPPGIYPRPGISDSCRKEYHKVVGGGDTILHAAIP
jgi:amino acid permease